MQFQWPPKAPDRSRAAARCGPCFASHRRSVGPFRCIEGSQIRRTSQDRRSCSVPEDHRFSGLREIEDFAQSHPPHTSPTFCAPRAERRRFARLSSPRSLPPVAHEDSAAVLGPRTLAGAAARPLRGSQPRQRAPERSTGGFAIGGTSTRAGVSGIEDPAIFGRAPLFRNSGRGRLGGGFRGGFPPHLLAVSDCHTQ